MEITLVEQSVSERYYRWITNFDIEVDYDDNQLTVDLIPPVRYDYERDTPLLAWLASGGMKTFKFNLHSTRIVRDLKHELMAEIMLRAFGKPMPDSDVLVMPKTDIANSLIFDGRAVGTTDIHFTAHFEIDEEDTTKGQTPTAATSAEHHAVDVKTYYGAQYAGDDITKAARKMLNKVQGCRHRISGLSSDQVASVIAFKPKASAALFADTMQMEMFNFTSLAKIDEDSVFAVMMAQAHLLAEVMRAAVVEEGLETPETIVLGDAYNYNEAKQWVASIGMPIDRKRVFPGGISIEHAEKLQSGFDAMMALPDDHDVSASNKQVKELLMASGESSINELPKPKKTEDPRTEQFNSHNILSWPLMDSSRLGAMIENEDLPIELLRAHESMEYIYAAQEIAARQATQTPFMLPSRKRQLAEPEKDPKLTVHRHQARVVHLELDKEGFRKAALEGVGSVNYDSKSGEDTVGIRYRAEDQKPFELCFKSEATEREGARLQNSFKETLELFRHMGTSYEENDKRYTTVNEMMKLAYDNTDCLTQDIGRQMFEMCSTKLFNSLALASDICKQASDMRGRQNEAIKARQDLSCSIPVNCYVCDRYILFTRNKASARTRAAGEDKTNDVMLKLIVRSRGQPALPCSKPLIRIEGTEDFWQTKWFQKSASKLDGGATTAVRAMTMLMRSRINRGVSCTDVWTTGLTRTCLTYYNNQDAATVDFSTVLWSVISQLGGTTHSSEIGGLLTHCALKGLGELSQAVGGEPVEKLSSGEEVECMGVKKVVPRYTLLAKLPLVRNRFELCAGYFLVKDIAQTPASYVTSGKLNTCFTAGVSCPLATLLEIARCLEEGDPRGQTKAGATQIMEFWMKTGRAYCFDATIDPTVRVESLKADFFAPASQLDNDPFVASEKYERQQTIRKMYLGEFSYLGKGIPMPTTQGTADIEAMNAMCLLNGVASFKQKVTAIRAETHRMYEKVVERDALFLILKAAARTTVGHYGMSAIEIEQCKQRVYCGDLKDSVIAKMAEKIAQLGGMTPSHKAPTLEAVEAALGGPRGTVTGMRRKLEQLWDLVAYEDSPWTKFLTGKSNVEDLVLFCVASAQRRGAAEASFIKQEARGLRDITCSMMEIIILLLVNELLFGAAMRLLSEETLSKPGGHASKMMKKLRKKVAAIATASWKVATVMSVFQNTDYTKWCHTRSAHATTTAVALVSVPGSTLRSVLNMIHSVTRPAQILIPDSGLKYMASKSLVEKMDRPNASLAARVMTGGMHTSLSEETREAQAEFTKGTPAAGAAITGNPFLWGYQGMRQGEDTYKSGAMSAFLNSVLSTYVGEETSSLMRILGIPTVVKVQALQASDDNAMAMYAAGDLDKVVAVGDKTMTGRRMVNAAASRLFIMVLGMMRILGAEASTAKCLGHSDHLYYNSNLYFKGFQPMPLAARTINDTMQSRSGDMAVVQQNLHDVSIKLMAQGACQSFVKALQHVHAFFLVSYMYGAVSGGPTAKAYYTQLVADMKQGKPRLPVEGALFFSSIGASGIDVVSCVLKLSDNKALKSRLGAYLKLAGKGVMFGKDLPSIRTLVTKGEKKIHEQQLGKLHYAEEEELTAKYDAFLEGPHGPRLLMPYSLKMHGSPEVLAANKAAVMLHIESTIGSRKYARTKALARVRNNLPISIFQYVEDIYAVKHHGEHYKCNILGITELLDEISMDPNNEELVDFRFPVAANKAAYLQDMYEATQAWRRGDVQIIKRPLGKLEGVWRMQLNKDEGNDTDQMVPGLLMRYLSPSGVVHTEEGVRWKLTMLEHIKRVDTVAKECKTLGDLLDLGEGTLGFMAYTRKAHQEGKSTVELLRERMAATETTVEKLHRSLSLYRLSKCTVFCATRSPEARQDTMFTRYVSDFYRWSVVEFKGQRDVELRTQFSLAGLMGRVVACTACAEFKLLSMSTTGGFYTQEGQELAHSRDNLGRHSILERNLIAHKGSVEQAKAEGSGVENGAALRAFGVVCTAINAVKIGDVGRDFQDKRDQDDLELSMATYYTSVVSQANIRMAVPTYIEMINMKRRSLTDKAFEWGLKAAEKLAVAAPGRFMYGKCLRTSSKVKCKVLTSGAGLKVAVYEQAGGTAVVHTGPSGGEYADGSFSFRPASVKWDREHNCLALHAILAVVSADGSVMSSFDIVIHDLRVGYTTSYGTGSFECHYEMSAHEPVNKLLLEWFGGCVTERTSSEAMRHISACYGPIGTIARQVKLGSVEIGGTSPVPVAVVLGLPSWTGEILIDGRARTLAGGCYSHVETAAEAKGGIPRDLLISHREGMMGSFSALLRSPAVDAEREMMEAEDTGSRMLAEQARLDAAQIKGRKLASYMATCEPLARSAREMPKTTMDINKERAVKMPRLMAESLLSGINPPWMGLNAWIKKTRLQSEFHDDSQAVLCIMCGRYTQLVDSVRRVEHRREKEKPTDYQADFLSMMLGGTLSDSVTSVLTSASSSNWRSRGSGGGGGAK